MNSDSTTTKERPIIALASAAAAADPRRRGHSLRDQAFVGVRRKHTAATPCNQWNACGYPSCTYSRSGWCPGYVACHHNDPCDNDLDFTADLPGGSSYLIDYNVTPKNGSWPISLVLYWYE